VGAPRILLSAGFFTSLLSPRAETPGRTIVPIYAGACLLAVSVLTLGIGLMWRRPQPAAA